MKINELRYRNWIMSKSSSVPFEVYIGDFEPIFDNPEHYFGIPITNEWLLKFGFRHVKDNWYNVHANGNTFNVYLFISKVGYRVEIVSQSIGTFKHVHQLQNLYFALTGEELTCKS